MNTPKKFIAIGIIGISVLPVIVAPVIIAMILLPIYDLVGSTGSQPDVAGMLRNALNYVNFAWAFFVLWFIASVTLLTVGIVRDRKQQGILKP